MSEKDVTARGQTGESAEESEFAAAEKYFGFKLQEFVDAEYALIQDYIDDGLDALQDAIEGEIKDMGLAEKGLSADGQALLKKILDKLGEEMRHKYAQEVDVYEIYLTKSLFRRSAKELELAELLDEEDEERGDQQAGSRSGLGNQQAECDVATVDGSSEEELAAMDEELRQLREKVEEAVREHPRLKRADDLAAKRHVLAKAAATEVDKAFNASIDARGLAPLGQAMEQLCRKTATVDGLGVTAQNLLPALGEEVQEEGENSGEAKGLIGAYSEARSQFATPVSTEVVSLNRRIERDEGR